MTRLETGLLDLAESFLRNDDIVHDADYQTLYSIATDVGEVESENAKLQDENARLRSCLSDDAENARMIMGENAKLRELVADMWFWHYEGHIDSESRKRQMLHINAVIQSMRELGIEVE